GGGGSGGSTFGPATSSSTGSMPSPRAASTRSSPSQTNRPSFSRCRADASRLTSFSVLFSADVIKPLAVVSHPRDDPGVLLGPERDLERVPRAALGFLIESLRRDPAERRVLRGLAQRRAHASVALRVQVLR